MIAKELYLDLIGKEYREGGHGPEAFDCWGVVLEIYRRAGIALPNYGEAQARADHRALGGWEAVEVPAGLEVILIRGGDGRWHTGVCLGGDRFIHSQVGLGVTIDRFTVAPWARMTEGFFRWKPGSREGERLSCAPVAHEAGGGPICQSNS